MTRMTRTLAVFLCVLFGVVPLLGQPAQPPTAPAAAPSAAASDDQPAFTIETLHHRARFETDGTGTREMVLTVKVLDELAVRQWGQIALPYQSESENLSIRSVQVKKPDGSISSTGEGGVQDLSALPPALAPTFLDLRQKVITVSALRPGDAVTVNAHWTTTKPIAPGQFWWQHAFERGASVADEQLEINVPAKRTVALKIGERAPAEERGGSGIVDGDRRIYRWKRSFKLDPASPPKPTRDGDDEPPPDIRLSSFTNWNEFATWFAGLTSAAPDEAIKTKAADLTKGAADEAAKIAAIYRFVSSEIRYVSLSFGVGRFAAHPPAEVLKNQYGDCKDKAILLQALLAAAGVQSHSVLVNTNRSIAEDFASPLEFDHMVSVVRGGGGAETWLDPTLEVAPVGMLVAPLRDKKALRIDVEPRGRVVRTPADPPFPSIDRVDVTGTVNRLGVLVAKVVYTVRGDNEIEGRTIARSVPRSSLKDVAASLAATNGLEGEVSEVSITDPADTVAPFELTFELRVAGYLDWAAKQSQLTTLPTTKLAFAKEEERKDLERIFLGSPSTMQLRGRIELPEGYAFEGLPQPVKVSRAGVEYRSAYSVDGRRLAVEREIVFTAREIRASSFSDYAALGAAAEADFAQKVSVRGHVAATPDVPKDATANEIYKAAYSAYQVKRYDAALDLWKRTTETAPKMADAWASLGFAYEKLAKYDEAAAAMQKRIDLDPSNKRAHSDLAFVLKNAGRDEAAAKAYARHVELNPLDGEAFKELGFLYNDLRRPADAVVALEKASALLPRHAWLHAHLASAYLQLKEVEKGRRVVQRVMELSPNLAVRTFVAWTLAENRVDLDRAAEMARTAEKEAVERLRALDLKSVADTHLDDVERLAWLWDTIGWIDFQRGKLTEAERYVQAAWQLVGHEDVALHFGQIHERRNRLADALSYYLTAQALGEPPAADAIAHVKRLAGGGDLKLMLKSAKEIAPNERSFAVPAKGTGRAEFLAVVGSNARALEVRFLRGDDGLKPFADSVLREVTYPLGFPATDVRLVLGVRVACDAQQRCRGFLEYPSKVTLD